MRKPKSDKRVVQDYTLTTIAGKRVKLSKLFGKSKEMILIHNMGMDCPYCTLWADGFSPFYPYMEGKLAFVMENDETPAAMKRFVTKRKWKFPVVSSIGTPLKNDLGFLNNKGYRPGFSMLRKEAGGKIVRVKHGDFGPGDMFCSFWNLMDLTKDAHKKITINYQL